MISRYDPVSGGGCLKATEPNGRRWSLTATTRATASPSETPMPLVASSSPMAPWWRVQIVRQCLSSSKDLSPSHPKWWYSSRIPCKCSEFKLGEWIMYTILPYPEGNIQDCNLPKWHSIWTYRPPLSVSQASELPGYKSNFDAGKVGEWRLGLTKVEESTGKQRLFQGCIFWNLAMTTLVPCRSSRSWGQTANIKFKRNTNLKHQETSNSGKRNDQSPDSSPSSWLQEHRDAALVRLQRLLGRCHGWGHQDLPREQDLLPPGLNLRKPWDALCLEKIWASCQICGEMQRSISRLVDRTKKKQLSDSFGLSFFPKLEQIT